MNLYILKCVPGAKMANFVVRAKSKKEARQLASQSGDESWLDEKQTTCNLLVAEGNAEVIIRN